jgi:hypothetical protein
MLNRTHVTLILLLAVAVWTSTLAVFGYRVEWYFLKPFTVTVSVVTIVCLVFDRWLWRWRLFKGWLVTNPDLQGTWKAVLQSDWIDSGTAQGIAPIECAITIRQSFSSLSFRLFTSESSSYLVAHKLVRQNDGVFQLFGTYQNTPDIELRGVRSEIHYGALMLEVRGDPPAELTGHYWTDRGTTGSITLSQKIAQVLSSYDEAARQFGIAGPRIHDRADSGVAGEGS